jgi:PAS domain S-box-containing protein
MTSQDPKQSQAEKKLHDSENMFRILFETSQNAIFIMKENFFIECNQNSLEMFKCEHGDIIGHTLMEFSPAIQPDGTDSSNKAFAKIDAAWKGEPQLFEWQHKKFDGTLFDTEIRLNLIQLSTGPLILATVKDFTDHKIVENALSDSQNKYKTLFQKSADAILIIEGDKFVDCNDATVKMLKYDNKAELLETHPSALSPPRQPDGRDSFEKANEMMSIAIDHGSHRFEWDHKRKDGEVFPVEVLLTSVPLPEGHFIHVVWRDITARKKADLLLKESEERFRRLFYDLGDAVFVCGIGENGGIILEVNPSAEYQTGYSSDELIGMKMDNSLVVEGSGDLSFLEIDVKLLNGEPVTTTEMKRRKDGTEYWVEIVLTPIEYQGKKACISINRDISKRKRLDKLNKVLLQISDTATSASNLKELLKSIREILHSVIDTTNFYVGLYDKSTHTISEPYSEDTHDKYLSYPAGKTYTYYVIKTGRALFANDEISEVLEKKGDVETFGTDSKLWLGVPLITKDTVIGALAVQSYTDENLYSEGDLDILQYVSTEIATVIRRKQEEKDRAILEAQLRRSQKLETIGTLAGGIAHDFNNILTPILGFTQMAMIKMDPDETLYKDLEQILNGANRARDLVDQILLFSKQDERERYPIELQFLIIEAMKLLRPTIPTTIEITQDIDNSCGNVIADATQIHQVIVNLCTNAWQAMEESGGTISIDLKQVIIDESTQNKFPNLNNSHYACLSICDTGIGMTKSVIEHIFEPFFTTKKVDKGTGLGLSVVHGIILGHRGNIDVSSRPGEGTCFKVYLPIVYSKKETDKITDTSLAVGNESLLVVDDDEIVGNMIQRLLKELGYRSDLFSGSLEALNAFRDQPDKYDLVLTDFTMPDMTGVELSIEIQKIKSGTPIIIITGNRGIISSDHLKKAGILKILDKPIGINAFSHEIRDVLDNREGSAI